MNLFVSLSLTLGILWLGYTFGVSAEQKAMLTEMWELWQNGLEVQRA